MEGKMPFDNQYLDIILKLGASFLCGLLLGFERKSRQHAVGLRTLILISVSTCLLCILSIHIAGNLDNARGDPGRIAAAVVTGIGFLGTGAILRQGLNVRGLTSAAVIWTAAALGLACGAGLFFVVGITLLICLTTLLLFEKIEWRLFPAEKTKKLTIVYSGFGIDIADIQTKIANTGLLQRDFNMSESIEKERIELIFSVKAPGAFNLELLTKELMETGKIAKISISDD